MSGVPILVEGAALDVLVVGGGPVAVRKAAAFAAAGASVRIVALEPSPAMRDLARVTGAALIERAMSSASPITRDDLMPGAGSSSYSVTTGPGRALMISPLTPKSSSTLSSDSAFSSISSVEGVKRSLGRDAVRSESGGRA